MNTPVSVKRFARWDKAHESPLAPEMHRVGTFAEAETFVIDVEASNRCHARCTFCPRDRTPHQGFMTGKTFEQVLVRAIEFRSAITAMHAGKLDFSFCGLGESMLNPALPSFMHRATEEGFRPCLCANGDLLDQARAEALLDAGLADIFLNIGELGDAYDRVYGLSFERTVRNIEEFMHVAKGRCNVWIVLVDHRMDENHLARVKAFWSERGVKRFFPSPMLNRARAIEHEAMNFHDHPMEAAARSLFGQRPPGCYAPVQCLVIGYDGNFYLCNSDWRKEEAAGSVFDISILESIRIRVRTAQNREHSICHSCNHDPLNQVSRLLAQHADSTLIRNSIDVLAQREVSAAAFLHRAVEHGHLPPEP
jgi:MoaA/NifB/PqqE/SkfB family radical SAM enzyme